MLRNKASCSKRILRCKKSDSTGLADPFLYSSLQSLCISKLCIYSGFSCSWCKTLTVQTLKCFNLSWFLIALTNQWGLCVTVGLLLVQTERQVSRWFVQCLREQSMLLEVIFLYYAYFEMGPDELLEFAKMFKEQGFGTRQTNRHLVDESMDHLVDRIG